MEKQYKRLTIKFVCQQIRYLNENIYNKDINYLNELKKIEYMYKPVTIVMTEIGIMAILTRKIPRLVVTHSTKQ